VAAEAARRLILSYMTSGAYGAPNRFGSAQLGSAFCFTFRKTQTQHPHSHNRTVPYDGGTAKALNVISLGHVIVEGSNRFRLTSTEDD